ncbi:hypothetical protein ABPG72_017458 [Tetrahymena utriculariae]
MDCSQQQIIQKCQKHVNQNIDFLQIFIKPADYMLSCKRCLSVVQGQCCLFDLKEILSEESEILPYWPLSQSENDFDEMLQILQSFETEEYQQKISQKIKKLRTMFDDQIFKLENKLLECSSDKIKQEFYLKYHQAAQIKELIQYLNEELNQNNQQKNTNQKFKDFLQKQIEKNEMQILLKYLKESQQKQETNLSIFTQITESLESVFQDPQFVKQAQDKIKSKQNQEQNELQIKVENLLTQLEELKEKNQQEQNLKSQEIKKLTSKINQLTETCNNNLNFSKYQDQKTKQYENYFLSLNSKQFELHIHQLNLTWNCQRDSICCDKCGQDKLTASWNCSLCNYNSCQSCIQKEEKKIFRRAQTLKQYKESGQILLSYFNRESITLNQHKHELNLISASLQKRIFCDICKTKNILFSWNCEECDFDVCLRCSGLQKEFDQHSHQLKLTNSHKMRYPFSSLTGCTRCDSCSKNNIELSWHCFLCKYDLCLDCSDLGNQ